MTVLELIARHFGQALAEMWDGLLRGFDDPAAVLVIANLVMGVVTFAHAVRAVT